jgi:uncharacterized integral membrane protein
MTWYVSLRDRGRRASTRQLRCRRRHRPREEKEGKVADTLVSKTISRIKHLSPRTIVAIVIGVVALIFIFQNTGDAQIHILFWHSNRPLWLWLLLLFAGGFVAGSIFPWFHRRQKPTTPASSS